MRELERPQIAHLVIELTELVFLVTTCRLDRVNHLQRLVLLHLRIHIVAGEVPRLTVCDDADHVVFGLVNAAGPKLLEVLLQGIIERLDLHFSLVAAVFMQRWEDSFHLDY